MVVAVRDRRQYNIGDSTDLSEAVISSSSTVRLSCTKAKTEAHVEILHL